MYDFAKNFQDSFMGMYQFNQQRKLDRERIGMEKQRIDLERQRVEDSLLTGQSNRSLLELQRQTEEFGLRRSQEEQAFFDKNPVNVLVGGKNLSGSPNVINPYLQHSDTDFPQFGLDNNGKITHTFGNFPLYRIEAMNRWNENVRNMVSTNVDAEVGKAQAGNLNADTTGKNQEIAFNEVNNETRLAAEKAKLEAIIINNKLEGANLDSILKNNDILDNFEVPFTGDDGVERKVSLRTALAADPVRYTKYMKSVLNEDGTVTNTQEFSRVSDIPFHMDAASVKNSLVWQMITRNDEQKRFDEDVRQFNLTFEFNKVTEQQRNAVAWASVNLDREQFNLATKQYNQEVKNKALETIYGLKASGSTQSDKEIAKMVAVQTGMSEADALVLAKAVIATPKEKQETEGYITVHDMNSPINNNSQNTLNKPPKLTSKLTSRTTLYNYGGTKKAVPTVSYSDLLRTRAETGWKADYKYDKNGMEYVTIGGKNYHVTGFDGTIRKKGTGLLTNELF